MQISDAITIASARLVLRFPRPGDEDAITAGIGQRDVAWNLGRAPWPYERAHAEAWIARCVDDRAAGRELAFVITHPKHGLIGSIGLKHIDGAIWEIGYWLAQPFWGQGFVSEAARTLLDWSDNYLGIERYVSGHFIDNPASGRVLEKLGFEVAGEVMLSGMARGAPSPCLRYYKGTTPEVALQSASH